MIQNGCMHFTTGCKYACDICFEDINVRPWMVSRECVKYFKLERNIMGLGIKGFWDIRKPFETPPNLCDHVLCYCEEVSLVTPQ